MLTNRIDEWVTTLDALLELIDTISEGRKKGPAILDYCPGLSNNHLSFLIVKLIGGRSKIASNKKKKKILKKYSR